MIEVAGLSSVTDTESLRVSGLGNARLLLVNCLRERFAQMLEDMKKPIQVRLPSHNHILVIRDPSRTARKRTILPSNLSPDSAKIKATDLLLSDMYRPRWNTSPRRNLGGVVIPPPPGILTAARIRDSKVTDKYTLPRWKTAGRFCTSLSLTEDGLAKPGLNIDLS